MFIYNRQSYQCVNRRRKLRKIVYIISDKYDVTKKVLITDMELGGTMIKSNGMYTNEERNMSITAVHSRKLSE